MMRTRKFGACSASLLGNSPASSGLCVHWQRAREESQKPEISCHTRKAFPCCSSCLQIKSICRETLTGVLIICSVRHCRGEPLAGSLANKHQLKDLNFVCLGNKTGKCPVGSSVCVAVEMLMDGFVSLKCRCCKMQHKIFFCCTVTQGSVGLAGVFRALFFSRIKNYKTPVLAGNIGKVTGLTLVSMADIQA